MKHSHYHKDVSQLATIDVYRVLDLFGVTDPCEQHAIKKLLCAGLRGAKSHAQDIQEAIDTLERWKAMRQEDIANSPLAPRRHNDGWPEILVDCIVCGSIKGHGGLPCPFMSVTAGARGASEHKASSYPAVEQGVDVRFDQSGRQEVVEQNGNDGAIYGAD